MHEPNFLQTLWFALIGVLWIGYFVLEAAFTSASGC